MPQTEAEWYSEKMESLMKELESDLYESIRMTNVKIREAPSTEGISYLKGIKHAEMTTLQSLWSKMCSHDLLSTKGETELRRNLEVVQEAE
jgi:hypothetical protein